MSETVIAPLPNPKTSFERRDIGSITSTSSRLPSNRQTDEFDKSILTGNATSNQESESPDRSTDASESVASTPERMNRQRTAVVAAPEDLSAHKDDESPPQSATSTDVVSQICLCQPDPKIPRPRNAFILYRQHHQHNITSRHRGLSNPEISKIAGQLWQAEPQGVKNTWKAFADEEKARHALQYPDYRFQPRHKNKTSPTLSSKEKVRCQRCGGHSIAIASSSFLDPLPPSNATDSPINNSPLPAPQKSILNSSCKLQGAMLTSNEANDARYSASGSLITRRFPDSAIELSEPKRRRYESYRPSISVSSPEVVRTLVTGGHDPTLFQSPYPSPRIADSRRGSLPASGERLCSVQRGSQSLSTSSPSPPTPRTAGSVMGPPPARIASISGRNGLHAYPATPTSSKPNSALYPAVSRARNNSESLRLAPLLSPAAGEHSRSIEAMIMSIPVIGKLGQLRRIAPPFKDPSPALRPYHVRGSIIAIEGDDRSVADAMLCQLETFLRRNDEFDVRVLTGPRDPGQRSTLKNYIDMVSGWHNETKRMIEFITGADYQQVEERRESEGTLEHRHFAKTPRPASDEDAVETEVEGSEPLERERKAARDMERQSHALELKRKREEMSAAVECEARRINTVEEQTSKIPLLLISNYILHGSDAWSSALPINDVYSPADHWAWTATLWRGIVGPDLTVYVRSMEREKDEPMSAGGVGPSTMDKKVEMKDDVGAILVKRENGKVEDGAVRRVAFEVGEWVRMQAGKQS